MKQGDHANTLVRDKSQETALLHFPPLLPPPSQMMVSNHPPGEKGFFKCVFIFFVVGRMWVFLGLQRQKDLPAFICSIPLHQRRISYKPDREDQASVWRQAVSKLPRNVVSATCLYTYFLSSFFLLLFPLFSFSLSLCWNYFQTQTYF